MAVNSRAVTVAATATRLDSANRGGQGVVVYNAGDAVVYLGGPTVTTATGIPVAATSYGPGIDLEHGDLLYGIVEADTEEVRVFETGV